MGHVNQIWQGDANACLARSFPLCAVPARVINLTGTEVLRVREIAGRLGELLGREPLFQGQESPTALLGDAAEMARLWGPPSIPPDQIIAWVAEWVKQGGPTLNKPTKYESRTGQF